MRLTRPVDRHRPLVVACLRHTDPHTSVDPLTGSVLSDASAGRVTPADEAALEHAVRIAWRWDADLLAVSAGTADADGTLRGAAAAGAAVLRVPWPTGDLTDLAGDERALARAVVGAVRGHAGEPDLVVCGDRSADRGTGAFPAFLAHELGAAQALGLVRLQPDGAALLAERRLDGGRRERLRVPRPAVCSVEAAGVRPRRAPLAAVLSATSLTVPVAPGSGRRGYPAGPLRAGAPRPSRPRTKVVTAPTGSVWQRLAALTGAVSDREAPTVLGPLDAAAAADAVVGFLARHGYLDRDHPEGGG